MRTIDSIITSYYYRREHILVLESKEESEENFTMKKELESQCYGLIKYIKDIDKNFNTDLLESNYKEIYKLIVEGKENIKNNIITQFKKAYYDMISIELSKGDLSLCHQLFMEIKSRLILITPSNDIEKLNELFDSGYLTEILCNYNFSGELNEIILVTDTKGLVVEAKVVEIGPGKILKAEIMNKKQHKIQNPIVCVAQAVAKGDRADLSIEILTEVGVDKIIPWQANRSVSKLENKTEKLIQKWQSIARESTKQARRSFMPEILNLVNSKDLVDEFQNFENIIVLDPDSSVNFTDAIKNNSKRILLVIGPEGGIDENEMTLFKNANVVFASLGESILRTSSAGAISAAILLAQTKWIK